MTENESVKFFLRFIQEQHEIVKQRMNTLFQALSSDNHDEKLKANMAFLDACEDLSRTLSDSDRPKWLGALISTAQTYAQKHISNGQNFQLLNHIVSHRNHALSHVWSFEKSASEETG